MSRCLKCSYWVRGNCVCPSRAFVVGEELRIVSIDPRPDNSENCKLFTTGDPVVLFLEDCEEILND